MGEIVDCFFMDFYNDKQFKWWKRIGSYLVPRKKMHPMPFKNEDLGCDGIVILLEKSFFSKYLAKKMTKLMGKDLTRVVIQRKDDDSR